MEANDLLKTPYRASINVLAWHRPKNPPYHIIPKCIEWEDGQVYTIDEILEIARAPSRKAGGTGIRYVIRIGMQTTNIWYDESRPDGDCWFAERKNI